MIFSYQHPKFFLPIPFLTCLLIKKQFQIRNSRDFAGSPVVKILQFHCRVSGLIPGQETKIPHATRPKTKQSKQRQKIHNSRLFIEPYKEQESHKTMVTSFIRVISFNPCFITG